MQSYTITWTLDRHHAALRALKARGIRPGNMRVSVADQTCTASGWCDQFPKLPRYFVIAVA